MTKKAPLSEFHHVGIIIKDLDKTVQYYESLGFGPFKPLVLNVKERMVWGEPMEAPNLKVKMGYAGTVRLELIQPDENIDSLWKRFLENRGEGINHLAYVAHDIDGEESELVDKGYRVMFKARWVNGGATYFATDKIGGTIIEIFQE